MSVIQTVGLVAEITAPKKTPNNAKFTANRNVALLSSASVAVSNVVKCASATCNAAIPPVSLRGAGSSPVMPTRLPLCLDVKIGRSTASLQSWRPNRHHKPPVCTERQGVPG